MKWIVIALLIIASCSNSITGEVVGDNQIKVAWMGPLTGEFASIGIPNLEGVQLAIDEVNALGGINGVKIRLLIEDDQMIETRSVTAYQKLLIQDVTVIFTPSYGSTLALEKQALQDGVLLVSTIDTSEELAAASDGVVAIGIYDESIGYALAEDINNQGYKKIIVLNNLADPFMLLLKEAMHIRLDNSIQVIDLPYDPAQTDFRSELLKAKNADALIILGWDEVGGVFKHAQELDINSQRYAIDTIISDTVIETAGDALYGTRFTFWEERNDSVTEEFLRSYNKKYGRDPTNLLFTAVGYDAAHIVAKAMQEGGFLPDALRELEPHYGVSAIITIDEDGASRSVEEEMFIYSKDGVVKVD